MKTNRYNIESLYIEHMFVKMKGMNIDGIEQDKLNALNQALGKIEKDFGKGSVMKLGEATSMK